MTFEKVSQKKYDSFYALVTPNKRDQRQRKQKGAKKQREEPSRISYERTVNSIKKTKQRIEKIWCLLSVHTHTHTHIHTHRILRVCDLDLRSGGGHRFSVPCLLHNTRHIHWFHPPKQSTKKKQKIFKKMKPPANRIVLPWPVYTEPVDKRGRFGIQP